MKHETGLTRRVSKVSYFLGYFFFPLLFLAGFSIIPWVWLLYFVLFSIVVWAVLIITGWRQHNFELCSARLAEYLAERKID